MFGRPKWLYTLLLAAYFVAPSPAHSQSAERTFLLFATPPGSTLESVAAQAKKAMESAGWELLTEYDAGTDRNKCSYRSRVIIADWPDHTKAVMRNDKHGAFAAQIRVAVFEDESGVHLAAVNPRSLNRTIVAEHGRDEEWKALAHRLEEVLQSGGAGKIEQFGQSRDEGRIGRTMGVMAGGPFTGKVRTIVTVPIGDQSLSAFTEVLYAGLKRQEGSGTWHLAPVFRQNIPGSDVAVIGITSPSMEAKSFDIVKAGGNDVRSRFRCPGIDHAGAYPIELVLVKSGQTVSVQMIDEMYRMKMYFEDAGKLAFMRNMGMPGSIEGEIKDKVRSVLTPGS